MSLLTMLLGLGLAFAGYVALDLPTLKWPGAMVFVLGLTIVGGSVLVAWGAL